MFLKCNEAIPTNDEVPVTATDNCDDNVELTYEETQVPGTCLGAYNIVRTWTATDDCGNTSTATQTISIVNSIFLTIPPHKIYIF